MYECSICNSPITSPVSIDRGMGSECYAAYKAALRIKCFEVEDFSLHYNWVIKAGLLKSVFIETFAPKRPKFRSEFKKSFYDSVFKSERLSKKMLDIMVKWLCGGGYAPFDDHMFSEHETNIDQLKRDFLEKFVEENDLKVSSKDIEVQRRK